MQNDKYILIETQYLPPIEFFAFQINIAGLVINDAENYQKGSYRNRCHILGANGIMRLSVPLKGGRNHARSIKEVEISFDEKWQQIHLQSIRSAYGTSPYFGHYFDDLSEILNHPFHLLCNLNKRLLEFVYKALNMEINFEENRFIEQDSDACIDLRNKLSPKQQTSVFQLTDFHPYYQMFSDKLPFAPNLSILDLLFNLGPESRLYLIELSKKLHIF